MKAVLGLLPAARLALVACAVRPEANLTSPATCTKGRPGGELGSQCCTDDNYFCKVKDAGGKTVEVTDEARKRGEPGCCKEGLECAGTRPPRGRSHLETVYTCKVPLKAACAKDTDCMTAGDYENKDYTDPSKSGQVRCSGGVCCIESVNWVITAGEDAWKHRPLDGRRDKDSCCSGNIRIPSGRWRKPSLAAELGMGHQVDWWAVDWKHRHDDKVPPRTKEKISAANTYSYCDVLR